MSQFYSGSDLKRGVLKRCGQPTDGTSPYDQVALTYINQVYFSLIAASNEFNVDCGEVWNWAKARNPLILTLIPPFGQDDPAQSDGTVSVTLGSTAGTFSMAPTYSLKDQFFSVDDGNNSEKYRIAAHTANSTSFTLDGPYNGSTASAASFRVINIVYPIGDDTTILRLVEPFRVYRLTFDEDRNYQIYGLDANSFNMNYPLATIVSGIPNRFVPFFNDQNKLCVRFNQWTFERLRVEIDYIPPPAEIEDSDQSIPLVPRAFRSILEFGATYYLMTDMNDSRAQSYFSLTQQKMRALVDATRKEETQVNSKSKGVLFARQEYLRVRQRLQSFLFRGNGVE